MVLPRVALTMLESVLEPILEPLLRVRL